MSLKSRIADFEALLPTPDAQVLLHANSAAAKIDAWPPLPERPCTKPFPLSALPVIGRDMAEAVATHVQAPIDMAACFVLGAVSTCIVGRGKVLVRSGYEEQLQTYIVVAADPSERKSPAMKPIFEPVLEYERKKNIELAPILRDNAALASMKKRLQVKAENQGKSTEVCAIAAEIEELEALRPFMLTITDGSPEALASVMALNDGRIAVVSAEGALLDVLGGMYSDKGVNLDVILQGYTGEPIHSLRISRQTPRIDKAALSITLAAQPVAVDKLLSNETLVGRGVVSRFLICHPPSLIGTRDPENSRPIPAPVRERYAERLTSILERGEASITLSPSAQSIHLVWEKRVEKAAGPGARLSRLPAGWGGKICGNTIRIAGLLCLLEGESDVISGPTMQAAISIAEYFVNQMTVISGSETSLSRDAAEVLRFVIDWGQDEYKPADLRQALRSRKRFERGSTVDRALSELAEAGYIRMVQAEAKAGPGRPPQAMHQVHPDLRKPKARGEVMKI